MHKLNTILRFWRLWKRYPHLRLAQLLGNYMNRRDTYYDEDLKFIQSLEDFYKGWDIRGNDIKS